MGFEVVVVNFVNISICGSSDLVGLQDPCRFDLNHVIDLDLLRKTLNELVEEVMVDFRLKYYILRFCSTSITFWSTNS